MLQGDGVYSRYVPSLPTGKFSIVIYIEGMLGDYTFVRHLNLGIINVFASPSYTDKIAPARIVDLRSSVLPNTQNQVSFTWTAPGGDFDFGIAKNYVAKVSQSRDMDNGQYSFIDNWPQPLPAYSIQQHTIEWTSFDVVNYVGIYSMDEAGNISPISNLVSISIPSITTVAPPPELHASSEEDSGTTGGDTSASRILQSTQLTTIVYIVLTVVGILVLCLTICCFVAKYNKGSGKSVDDPDNFVKDINASNEKNPSGQLDTSVNMKKEFMSPVESWSASQLLDSHKDTKRSSYSTRSDDASEHSSDSKKSYSGFSATNDFYGTPIQFQYNHGAYMENYPIITNSNYPTPTEGYHPPPSELYLRDDFSSNDNRISSPQSDSFLSVSCDIPPVSHGPPGYQSCGNTLRSSKVPPPIPPKPKGAYSTEPLQYDVEDGQDNSANGSERRVRNVTMV